MSRLRTDVCVIGAGPAGAAAARRLALLGHRVCLVERSLDRWPAGESLAPSIVPALDALGVLADVERASFLRCGRSRLRWSAAEASRDYVTVLIDRDRFDRILRDAAVRAGASLLCPARARRPIRGPSRWTVPVDGAEVVMIDAAFVVDATGRRASVPAQGPATVALCGRWRGVALPAAPEMLIEAGADAWVWGAPVPDGSFAALVFLDTRRCAGLDRAGRAILYRSVLERSSLLAHCLRGTLIGDIVVRDATCRIDADPVTTDFIRVGDRALALDPLSSQGVQAAIRSGAQAAAVIHTILTGGDSEAALAFYRDAQQAAGLRHRRAAASVYAEQTLHASPFWRERAGPVLAGEPAPVLLPPRAALRLSADARMLQRPVIDGDTIRRRTVLSHPNLEQPVAWLGGIELCPLLQMIGAGRTGSDLLSDWAARMPAAAAADLLAWLTHHRVLVRSEPGEEAACLAQVGSIEAFGESAIDRREQGVRL